MEIVNALEQCIEYDVGDLITFEYNDKLVDGVLTGLDPEAQALIVTASGATRPAAYAVAAVRTCIELDFDEYFDEEPEPEPRLMCSFGGYVR